MWKYSLTLFAVIEDQCRNTNQIFIFVSILILRSLLRTIITDEIFCHYYNNNDIIVVVFISTAKNVE